MEPRKPAEAKGVRDNDGAARAGQDPPVQAGRQESNNGKARQRHHGQRWQRMQTGWKTAESCRQSGELR